MRSKANFRGHASHPGLIPFPLAFLIGAFGFDAYGVWRGGAEFWTTGAHLATVGVLAGLVAAVPGIIDYRFTVPPKSSARKRAMKHGLLNVTALVLFALARWLRGDAGTQPDVPLLAAEALGAALLVYAGWLGGTLVGRNQIGVDHRYANAGKWREVTIREPRAGEAAVVDAKDLEVNQMRLLRVGDKRFVLGRTDTGYVVFDDHCTHRGGSLAGGTMICGTVQCPWHGSQFDVATGFVKAGPAKTAIRVYRVDQRDGKLEIHGLTDRG